jgi:hypothetical protein
MVHGIYRMARECQANLDACVNADFGQQGATEKFEVPTTDELARWIEGRGEAKPPMRFLFCPMVRGRSERRYYGAPHAEAFERRRDTEAAWLDGGGVMPTSVAPKRYPTIIGA